MLFIDCLPYEILTQQIYFAQNIFTRKFPYLRYIEPFTIDGEMFATSAIRKYLTAMINDYALRMRKSHAYIVKAVSATWYGLVHVLLV